jgi:hypothetical protein
VTGPVWDGDGVDPWLPSRLAAQARIVEAERSLFDGFLARLSGWLVRVARSVLSGVRPDPAGVWSQAPHWRRLADGFAQGPVRDVVGQAFAPLLGDGYRWDLRPGVVAHLAAVSNRLVNVPDDVYALVAGQVAEGANAGESIGNLSTRVDEVLSATATPRWTNRSTTVARTECLTGGAVVQSDGIQAVYRRWYEGPVLRVHMASGYQFTGTPNHPVLTPGGWLPVGALNPGHQLVRHGGGQGLRSSRDEHIGDVPAMLSEVYDSLAAVGVVVRAQAGQPDFHGDGRDGYVDVATTDRELARRLRAEGSQRVADFSLEPPDMGSATLRALRHPLTVSGHAGAAHDAERAQAPGDRVLVNPIFRSDVGSGGALRILGDNLVHVDVVAPARSVVAEYPMLRNLGGAAPPDLHAVVSKDQVDGPFVGAVSQGQRLLAVASGVRGHDAGLVQVGASDPADKGGSPALRYPGAGQYGANPLAVDAMHILQGGERDARPVGTDDVVRVERLSYSGHVYNLSTNRGWFGLGPFYSGNTIAALNAGRHDAFQAFAQESGDGDLERMWLSTSDARTRDSHRLADGQRTGLTAPFQVGGASLMFPGDPAGPPDLVIQCRCVTVLTRPGEDIDLTDRGWKT